jgi:hypothetical protein
MTPPLPSMVSVGTEAPLAAATLVALGVDLVVVGGCALVLHGRTARCSDLDIVPEPGVANLGRLREALGDVGAKPPSAGRIGANTLSSVRSIFGRIDVMVATARREYAELAARSSEVRVAGVPVRVAAVADVLRLRAEFKGGDDE